ncbi:hypothetical protein VTO73DRAFT_11705 [Trametes versicolor]
MPPPPLPLHLHFQEKSYPGSGTPQQRRLLLFLRPKLASEFLAQVSPHRQRGETGRFIIALLTTDYAQTTKYDWRTMLFISERTVYPQEELYNMKTFVYYSPEDDAMVQAMYMIDSRLLLPPTGTLCAVILTLKLPLSKQPKGRTSSEDMGHSLLGRPQLRIGRAREHGQIVAYVVTSEGQHGLVEAL